MFGDAASSTFGELRHQIFPQGVKTEAREDDTVFFVHIWVFYNR